MDEDFDSEMREFRERMVDETEYHREDEQMRGQDTPFGYKPTRRALILAGAGVLILVLLIALFAGDDNELTTKEFTMLQARVDLLDKKLTRLEEVEATLAQLEKEGTGLQRTVRELERSGNDLRLQVTDLSKKIELLEKPSAAAPSAIQRLPLSLDKGRYHEVQPGDTLYKIAQKYGTSVEELCRLNNMTQNQVIYPGEKLLVAPVASQ